MSEYVKIEQAGNEAMAEMLKQRLDAAGIPCLLVPSDLGAVSGAGAGYSVAVPEDQADEARELLNAG